MMLKKYNNYKVCFINFQNNLNRFVLVNDKLIKSLSKNFKNIYILNLNNLRFFSKINYFSKKKNQKLLPNNFEIKNIDSYKDLEKFTKNKKLLIIMNSLSKNIRDFKIYYYLKKIDVKMIMIANLGMIGSKIFIDIKPSQFIKGYKHIFNKGFYYIWRLLTIINFFPKIHLLFESNAESIKAFKTGLSRKFESLIPFFQISLYRKIVRVNSKSFDVLYDNYNKNIKTNKNIKSKYILYIDSPIDHEDRTDREGAVNLLDVKEYNKSLFLFLDKISNLYKKKLFITLHPAQLKSFKKINNTYTKNKNIIVTKKKTIDLIGDSDLVIFSCSSAINHAIIFKKKILGINSKYFGIHLNKLHMRYVNTLKFPTINIDDRNLIFSKHKMAESFKKSIKLYENYTKRRLIYNNKPSYSEIPKSIKKFFSEGKS